MEISFSSKKEDMNAEYIHSFLTTSYWVEGISLEKIQKCIQNSLNFGIFLDQKQIGYARVVSDFVRFTNLLDVFIEPSLQGKGYGKMLLSYILEHPEIKNLPSMNLATRDAHTLYEKFGFTVFTEDQRKRHMILRKS